VVLEKEDIKEEEEIQIENLKEENKWVVVYVLKDNIGWPHQMVNQVIVWRVNIMELKLIM
jgi:hypothetical protein